MRNILLFFLALKHILSSIVDSENYICKTQLLQFYGLAGVSNPLHYGRLREDMNNDFCPGIEYSCCTREDFQLTIDMWNKNSDNIKRYVTKLFKVIQKTSILQGSLVNLAGKFKHNKSRYCRDVDFTYFNSAIKYDEVYFYIQNALEAFAFLQKGFYCTICDAKNHQYLGIDYGFTRRVAVVNEKFCNDLIFFFREFIMFKVFFIDPLVKNANDLFNCQAGFDKYHFNFHYNTTYYNLESCTEKGENCEYLCKEFKFGSTSELFIGSLKDYYDFFKVLENTVQKLDGDVKKDLDDEFRIDEREFGEEFFADPIVVNENQSYFLLKDFNMTNWEINIEKNGINMFDIAVHSNYWLTDASTRKVMIKNYGLNQPGDTDFSTKNKIETQVDIAAREYFERSGQAAEFKKEQSVAIKHQREKDEQNPFIPSKAEMAALSDERDRLEQRFTQHVRKKSDNQWDNGYGLYENGIPILSTITFFMTFLSSLFISSYLERYFLLRLDLSEYLLPQLFLALHLNCWL